jgi:heme-degrading monooxygenase HmoA
MSVVAITRVSFDELVEEEVLDLGKQAVQIFEHQPGFLGIQRYLAKEGNEIVTLTQWKDELSYNACTESRDWLLLMPQWCALQEDGDVQIDTKLMEVL